MPSEGTKVSFDGGECRLSGRHCRLRILGRLWTHCGMGRLEHENQGEVLKEGRVRGKSQTRATSRLAPGGNWEPAHTRGG